MWEFGVRTREESPQDRAARLRESMHFWLWRAIRSLEESSDLDRAIEYTMKAEETGLTLRKHLTGV